MRSLCGVQSHSLPVTSASRLSYWKTFIPAAPLCSGCGRLRFSYPRGLHVSFHLALGGPFTGTASVRLPPSRTLCETVSRFYFLVIGLKYHNMLIYYHHCGGQSRVFVSSRISAASVSLDPVVIPVLCTHPCRILEKPAISGNSNTHSCRIFAAMKKSGKQNIEKTDLPRNAPPFIVIFLYICIIFLINAGNSAKTVPNFVP